MNKRLQRSLKKEMEGDLEWKCNEYLKTKVKGQITIEIVRTHLNKKARQIKFEI